jgi:hypothetical protein
MIESRIPGGRYVIPVLLCLLVLTVATASAVYLYHALILPVVLGVSSLLRTGQIASTTVGAMIGSAIGSIVLLVSFRYTAGVLLKMQSTVLADYQQVGDSVQSILEGQHAPNFILRPKSTAELHRDEKPNTAAHPQAAASSISGAPKAVLGHPSLTMRCGVINSERDKSSHTEENNRENNRQRPENPGPWLSFPDVLYGIVQ